MSQSKDPAFLFYSQSFYESTRMMFPEERACYLDLLIYQHQNGFIPLNTDRIHLYCTGVSNEVVNQVLNQKFVKTEQGWKNNVMEKIVNERKVGNPKKRAYATLAGLLSSNNLTEEEAKNIKKQFKVDDFVNLESNELKLQIKNWFYGLVNVFVNNNKDKDRDKDKDIIKNITNTKISKNSNFQIPTVEEVKAYCIERSNLINPEYFIDFYSGKGWMVGKNKMKDWKACIRTWEKNSNNSGSKQLTTVADDNR